MKFKPSFQLKPLSCGIKVAILVTCSAFIYTANADPISENVTATNANTAKVPNNAQKMIFHKYSIMPNDGRRSAGRFVNFVCEGALLVVITVLILVVRILMTLHLKQLVQVLLSLMTHVHLVQATNQPLTH
jgi:hypothetical protein